MLRPHALLAAAVLAACAPPPPPAKTPVGRTPPQATPVRELPGPPGLPAVTLGGVSSAEAPVAFAVGPKGGLFAVVEDGRLLVRPFGAGPTVSGDAQPVAAVSGVGTGFTLRARQDGSFLLFWGERVDDNHVFKLQRINPDGKVAGGVLALPPVADAGVTFADFGTIGDRVVVVHEVTTDDRVSVYVTPIAPGLDRVEGPPKRVVASALTWYPSLSDAALGIVAVHPEDGAQATQTGRLEFVAVDASGKVTATKPIIGTYSAQIDAEIAAVEGGFVVGWTDVGQGGEGAVRVATLASDGSLIGAPTWVAPPIGQQALVSVTSAPTGHGKAAMVAWENIGQASDGARVIQLATVDGKGVASKERARMLYVDDDRPWIVSDGEGFAALTVAPAGAGAEPLGADAPTYPTLVRFAPDLSVRWAEPVRFALAPSDDGVPALALEPTCAEGTCYALAADGDGPVAYYVVTSAERESSWRAPAWRGDDERAPKVVELRSITDGPRLAGAHAAKLAGDAAPEVVAWVTYFLEGTTPAEPAPKGEAPYAATLALRFTQPDGSSSAPIEVSKRALSVGGVSVAPAPVAKKPEAVVAWVAQDKTGPQVYATKVDVDGKKVAQKKVTTVSRGTKGKAEEARLYASSVSIAASPASDGGKEGFVLAWIDTRDKNGELYVARLNKDLEKSVVDKRITNASGDASDVSVAVRDGEVFVAFADAREGKPSDIYFSHLDAFTLKEIDDDGRVYASAGRSRAPRVALAGKKILLAWIEEDVSASPKPSTLRIAEVDASGRLAQPPRTLAAPGGASVTGFGLTCGESVESCKLSLSWGSKDGRTEIGAATLDASGAPSEVRRLGTLASGPFAEPSFAFADRGGASLYYAEDLGARGRLRQLKLGW